MSSRKSETFLKDLRSIITDKLDLSLYIQNCYSRLPVLKDYEFPWEVTSNLVEIIEKLLSRLPDSEFEVKNNIAVHKSAIVEENVIIKEYSIIGKRSIVKAGAYLRGGVYIGDEVVIGANCEIKQSIIFNESRIAHLNYVGNSVIGEDVNMEAGSILANHFNERENKNIQVVIGGAIVDTNVTKFGSLVGDKSRIGANAVLNPGTVLAGRSIVGRLVHMDQIEEKKSGLR